MTQVCKLGISSAIWQAAKYAVLFSLLSLQNAFFKSAIQVRCNPQEITKTFKQKHIIFPVQFLK